MADGPSERVRSSVLAVLRAVKDAGLPHLTRTALVKFVYLLDYLYAEEHAGETASGSRWYFDKFGPFAADLASGIDSLERVGTIQSRGGYAADGDFTLYWLGEFPRGPSFMEVGLSINKAGVLEQWIRKFSRDLSKLLDFVYFHTDPMRDAVPGRALSFAPLAASDDVTSYSPVCVADQSRLYRLLELSNKMRERYRASLAAAKEHPAPTDIYDAVYANAMMAFDEEESDRDVAFHADLSA